MQVLILAGGKGTRLNPDKESPPKSLTIIDGKPILLHQINECIKYGFKDIHLLTGYKHKEIEKFFGNGSNFKISITYHVEKTPLGTGGAILNILPKLQKKFFVIYSDIFFNINLKSFLDFHEKKNADASLFVHPNNHPQDSDIIILNGKKRVIRILKKNTHDKIWTKNLVNAAIFVINKDILYGIDFSNKNLDLVNDVLIRLIDSFKIYGYLNHCYAKDMGTVRRLKEVQTDIKSSKVKNLSAGNETMAVFLDRDGVINEEIGYLSKSSQVKLINNASKAIQLGNSLGILMIIITNQSVVARGECSFEELNNIHNKIETLLGRKGSYLDAIYFCPHHPHKGYQGEIKSLKIQCGCRKPSIDLILKAQKRFNINLKKSWFIGDTTSDILTGKNAHTKTILVKTGHAGNDKRYKVKPDFFTNDIYDAMQLIVKNLKN